MELTKNRQKRIKFFLDILIIIDIILLIFSMIQGYDKSTGAYYYILIFDLFVCIALITEFAINYRKSANKKEFTKHNIIDLFASIPFEQMFFLIPDVNIWGFGLIKLLRLLRFFRILRVVVLIEKYFKNLRRFLKNSYLDKILATVIIIVLVFTLLLAFINDPGINHDPFDSLWFVIVTLTTVGYGDVVPDSSNARLVSLLLIIAGVFVFSTITGAISSLFTDKILKDENVELRENLHILNQKLNFNEIQMEKMNEQIEESNRTTSELKDEISELKKIIEEK